MVDLLATLGISAGWNFVFKSILEELAKNSATDFAKDFCKDALKTVLGDRDEWKKAAAKALKEFLEQFEQELIGAGETGLGTKAYTDSLRLFTKLSSVRETLGIAVTESELPVDFNGLASAWADQKLKPLPHDFAWHKLCRRYQSKVQNVLRDSPALRAILDSRYQAATAEATQRRAGIAPGFDTSKYADGLRKRYGHLKLESLDPNPDHQRIALTKIFVEQSVRSCQQFNPRLYELPVEYRRALRERVGLKRELEVEDLKGRRASFLQQAVNPVLEVVKDPRQRLCVVLGDPGSGKSMLLDYLAMQWAELPPVERAGPPLPLLIELRTYAENLGRGNCRDFLEYLDHGSGTVSQLDQGELDAMLQRGQATFLFDGLDEIFDLPTRKLVTEDLVRFTMRYPSARFLITSRSIGYDELAGPILRNAEFQHFLLQELDEAQQASFIQRWHELAYEDLTERAQKSGRLHDSIANVAAVRELAQNPLLLTLMALLNRHQDLPRDRNELYEQASRLMLQQWEAFKALRDDPLLADQSFDHKDKQAMLRAVALRMQTSPQGLAANVIIARDLQQTLVDQLKTQSYQNPKPIAVRLIQQLRERNFILCLLGDDFFAFVHRAFLEFFCAWAWVWKFEKGENGKRITIEALKRQTFDAHWDEEKWHEVLQLIAARLEPKCAATLLEGLPLTTSSTAVGRNYVLLKKCLCDLRARVPLNWLGNVQYRSLSSSDIVKLCAQNHDDPVARRLALIELVRCCREDSQTLRLLKERARGDADSVVRLTALNELVQGWSHDPDNLPLLRHIALSDPDPEVRRTAVRELARGWRDDTDILPLLKDLAHHDKNPGVRRVLVECVAQGWKDSPETLVWLKERFRKNRYWEVRQAIIELVANDWKNHPDTLPWLKNLVRGDKNGSVRQSAVSELQRGWPNHPDVKALPEVQEFRRRFEEASRSESGLANRRRSRRGP
jgi:HEAT repeats/NACHT domain